MKNIKNVYTIVFFILFAFTLKAQMDCLTQMNPPPQNAPIYGQGCDRFLDPDRAGSFPMFTVKMKFHFIGNGNVNFYKGADDDYNNMNATWQSRLLIDRANEWYANVRDNPQQEKDFLGDSRIRLKVIPDYHDGIYIWEDWNDYYNNYTPEPGVIDVRWVSSPCLGGTNTECLQGRALTGANKINMYHWQYAQQHGYLGWWDYAHLLVHEDGHMFGLAHAWLPYAECSYIDIDPTKEGDDTPKGWNVSTNQMSYNECQCALSPCQWSHLYSNIYDHNYDFADIDCDMNYDDIIVSSDETWDDKVIVMSNVRIINNATLTIKCDVELNTDSKIVVEDGSKLIVDGGHLTSLSWCGVDTWAGIKVTGGNSDFDVKIFNDALIENVTDAAVSMFPDLPWPQIKLHGNGILWAENSTFNNCRRMVEFIAFTPSLNGSFIYNCTQNGGRWGITNWNCLSVLVDNNQFNNVAKNCIIGIDASFTLQNNVFNSDETNVLLQNTALTIPSTTVTNNQFYGPKEGLKSTGATNFPSLITSNTFHNTDKGVFLDGDSRYFISNNNFEFNGIGGFCLSTGGKENKFSSNTFLGNQTAGIFTVSNNSGLTFLKNCFNTSFTDVFIIGKVDNQGDAINAASNCFTHQASPSSNVKDIWGSPEPFDYYEGWEDPGLDCYEAFLAHPNVNRKYLGTVEESQCFETPPPNQPMGGNGNNYSFVENSITPSTTRAKTAGTGVSKEDIKSIDHRRTAVVSSTRSPLSASSDTPLLSYEENVLYEFSLYLSNGDYIGAANYLQTIDVSSEQLSDFVTTQNINLWRLEHGPFASASAEDLNTLILIGQKQHPLAAYARALYFVLTGEQIEVTLPQIAQNNLTRERKERAVKKSILIQPNPFRDIIEILPTPDNPISALSVKDIFGQIYYNASEPGGEPIRIPTSNWPQGIYILIVKNSMGFTSTKLLHLR